MNIAAVYSTVADADEWHAHAKKIIDEGDFVNARYEETVSLLGDTQVFHLWDTCGVLLIFIN